MKWKSNFMGQAIENDLLKGLKGQGIERRWRWLCWWALMNAIMASELWISWVVWSSCSAHAIFNNQDNDRLWHCPSFATRGWWFSVCNAMIRCICYKQITNNPSAKTRGRNLLLSAQSASSEFYFLLPATAGSFGMTGMFYHSAFLFFMVSADCSRSALVCSTQCNIQP